MSKQVQIRRGTTAELAAATPALGELGYNSTKKTVVVGDGSQAGGFELMRADGATIHAAAGKTVPADADELALLDSAAANALKKLTWANLTAALSIYFERPIQLAKAAMRVAALMGIDNRIAALIAARPPMVTRGTLASATPTTSYIQIANVSFVAAGPTVRVSAAGFCINSTGGADTLYAKADIAGFAASEGPEQQATVGNGLVVNYHAHTLYTGLTKGVSYSARILAKRAGSSGTFTVYGTVNVENFG